MDIKISIDLSKANKADGTLCATFSFKEAFCSYMGEANKTPAALARETGVSEKTVRRYMESSEPKCSVRCLTALCIGLHLHISRSLQLFALANLSLIPIPTKPENVYYLEFLGMAYCSDLTVETCNAILNEADLKHSIG